MVARNCTRGGRGARGSFDVRIGIAPSSQSSPRQDASGRENFRRSLRRRCLRTLTSGSTLEGLKFGTFQASPPGVDSLTRRERTVKPDAIVWRGDASLPLEQQGVKILGVPIGQPECVRHFLSLKSVEHVERIPQVGDRRHGCSC